MRHHWFNIVRLAAAIVFLVVSTVGGAVVLGDPHSEPAEAFIFVQMTGVTWGSMYAVYPLLVDLADDLRERTPPRAWRLLTTGFSSLAVLAVVTLMFVATEWWYALCFVALTFVLLPAVMTLWENRARPAIVRHFRSSPD